MQMILMEKDLGPEAKMKMEINGVKIVSSMEYAGEGGGGSVSASMDVEYFLGKLAAAIPGSIDDAVIALIVAALKK